jgi:endonuclease YncB( thermonuclease family)
MKRLLILLPVLIASTLFSLPSHSDTMRGKVLYVIDGDTIQLLSNGKEERIRLAEIDTPETSQRYGNVAKQALAKWIDGDVVKVIYNKRGHYGRIIGTVYHNGTNINEKLVAEGHAWHFKRYSDSAKLSSLESKARNLGIGLWANPNPVAPWDYR